jgi:transcription initiation factor IIF auxiliary subunit
VIGCEPMLLGNLQRIADVREMKRTPLQCSHMEQVCVRREGGEVMAIMVVTMICMLVYVYADV